MDGDTRPAWLEPRRRSETDPIKIALGVAAGILLAGATAFLARLWFLNHALGCQRRLKSDPLFCKVAEVNLTHPGSFTSASRSRRAKPGATERHPHRHAAGTVLLAL